MAGSIVNFYKWIMYPIYESLKWQRVLVSLPLINLYYMWLSEQKPAMFAHRLNSVYCASLIATLNNYTRSLPPLANVNWSAFPQCFFSDHVNSRLVEWRQWRAPVWQWGSDIAPTLCTHLSRPCSGLLALCGCMWMS